jgi:outer membrane protein assembly factor BamB
MKGPEAPLMKRLLLLAILASPLSLVAQDAMFRGNPEHTGVYVAAGIPKFNRVRWQFHTQAQVLSSPVVAGDKLYFGSSDHYLYALDLATGAVKWKFKSEGRITSSPAVSAGLVYFGSYDANFYAVDAANGKLK